MQSHLVGVGEEADKVVLLQALRVVLVVNVGAGCARVPGWKLQNVIFVYYEPIWMLILLLTCIVPASEFACTSRSLCRTPWHSNRQADSL